MHKSDLSNGPPFGHVEAIAPPPLLHTYRAAHKHTQSLPRINLSPEISRARVCAFGTFDDQRCRHRLHICCGHFHLHISQFYRSVNQNAYRGLTKGGVTKTKSKTRRATSMNKPTSKQTNKQTNVHIIQFDNIINWRVIGLCVCRRRLSLLYVFVYNICSFGAVTSSHLHKIVWYIFCNQMNFKQQTHNHNKYVPGVVAVTGSLLLVAHPMPIVQSTGKFY